jgi:pyruvyl transferase EpsO
MMKGMDSGEKIRTFREQINQALLPLVDSDYVLLDLPYHPNLGDTLIWEGELAFLKQIEKKCLYYTNSFGYQDMNISKEVIILLHGGGNFGDVWPYSNDFRKRLISAFPNNRVIMFPQTVFYNSQANLAEDAALYNQYPNVTLCARDKKSYEILHAHMHGCQVLLLPDMAFFADVLERSHPLRWGNSVYVKRNDVELLSESVPAIVPQDAVVSDWPDVANSYRYRVRRKVDSWTYRLNRYWKTKRFSTILDIYWKHVLRPYNVEQAIDFIDRYDHIYTTRLHACILSVMLHKHVVLLDNSYGKNSSFFQTWLSDCEDVEFFNIVKE